MKIENFVLPKLVAIAIITAYAVALFVNPQSVSAVNTYSIDTEKDSSQYLSASDSSSLSITGDITVEAWIKLESSPTGSEYTIVGKWDSNGNSGRAWRFQVQDVGGGVIRLQARVENGSGSVTYRSAANTDFANKVGTWAHVAFTWDAGVGNAPIIYVNGVNDGSSDSATDSGAIGDNGNNTLIGGQLNNGSIQVPFDGKIDDVRIWNVVRTNTEVSDDMSRELNGNESGLVAYWKLNNGLSDSTSNSNSLTNNNSVLFVTDTPFSGFTESLKVRKNSSEHLSSSTVLQNDDSLKLSLAANTTYIIDGVIFASSTSATPDIKLGFFGQTGVDVAIGYTNDVNEMVLMSGDESSRINLPADTPTSIHIKGTVKTGSEAGDLQLKWAQSTSNGSATTVMKGSYLRAEAI